MKRVRAILRACLVLSVVLVQERLLAAGLDFSGPSYFPVSAGPNFVAIADLNGDGRPDLVSSSYSGDNVSVLLGTGSGSFGAATVFAVGDGPTSVAVGDFNRDGRPDLATANVGSDSVSVLLGTGAGGFGAATNFAVGDYPYSLALGDFNGDGRPDLVTGNSRSADLSVLLGNGTGGFGPATSVSAGIYSYPTSVVVADFNRDGRPDLATANYYDVTVLLGDGTGGFGTPRNFWGGYTSEVLTVGDFNSDGKPDLATAGWYSSSAAVLLGDGEGDFYKDWNVPFDGSTPSVVAGDFNGDGKDDLATPYHSYSIGVVLADGMGIGRFGLPRQYPIAGDPYKLAAGDLNGDGKPDLVSANFYGGNLSVLLNVTPVESIAFSPLADKTFGDAPFALSATATSGRNVNFSVVSGPATVVGNTLTLTGAGLVTVRASQPGSGFAVAPSVGRSFTVSKGMPVITWPTPGDIATGTALSAAQLNARASVAGTFTYTPPAGTLLLRGSNQPLTVSFLPADVVNYLPASATVRINVVNAAPGILSAPAATPNPATAGIAVNFATAASDNDNEALTYTWAFGDLFTKQGATATHTYAAAGTYDVVVTIDDGHGGRTSASLTLVVNPSYGTDSDADGFTDAIENAAGSSPFSAAETPTGAAANPLPLTNAKLSIKLNFARSGSDAISLSGSLFLPNGFVAANTALIVDIGGVARSFALGANGSARNGNDSAAVKSTGTASSIARFSIKLNKGDFAAILNSVGLADAEVSKVVNVPVTLILAGNMFQRQQQQVYKARAHKSGATKDKR